MTASGWAPGRLDLLGGVADYSGALVLEVPTQVGTTVHATPADALVVGDVEITPGELRDLAARDYSDIRATIAEYPRWTHYLLGVAIVLARHDVIEPPRLALTVSSDLPQSIGLSSSAALEVATARALGADTAANLDPLHLALLCQEAENHVVGAPCGVMDQVTVTMGRAGAVLPILCRPASVDIPVDLPDGLEVVGWPTGAEHDVSGVPYRRARIAAFMGKRIAEDTIDASVDWISELPVAAVQELPASIDGRTFRDRWGTTDDTVTTVDPDLTYPVRAATSFGVEEHRRGGLAVAALRRGDTAGLGRLMAASHAGYDAMGLGHPAATVTVAAALATPGVHGARSSGGGSGGTVVVLCDDGALDHVPGVIR